MNVINDIHKWGFDWTHKFKNSAKQPQCKLKIDGWGSRGEIEKSVPTWVSVRLDCPEGIFQIGTTVLFCRDDPIHFWLGTFQMETD